MANESLFWVVWAEGGGNPTVKHGSQETANAEARRLARSNPGIRFVVLQPVHAVVKNDLITTTFKRAGDEPQWGRDMDEDLPF